MSSSDNITPDCPEMRSVMMRPNLSEVTTLPQELLSHNDQVVRRGKPDFSLLPQPPVNDENIKTKPKVLSLPRGYPLERSHVYVKHSSLDQIATRITDCLRVESVVVQYEEALFRCETREHVKFVVRFFSADDKTVVEIQRTAGCCFLFHRAARIVLRAALDQPPEPCVELTVPPAILSEEEEQEAIEDALELAWTMLENRRYDSRLLAMESLASLTKANPVAAKSLVNGKILTKLLIWIDAEEAEDYTVASHDYLVKMHRYALVILANCLTALTLNDIPSVSDKILNSLIGALRAARVCPHNACEAAKSLKSLVRSEDVRSRALSMGAYEALIGAHKKGKSCHKQLEKESLSLQIEMGN